ncbi:MAG: histidine kinase [Gammaproteobacteria bacterium]|jgi:two-component system nitrate/nitrite sensor histidine kinase NarX|nr:histidine kinase [Gammaproteobacteria bacterium]|tara:strand:+ start:789 stop:2267 length:1479 start_codon:yes stop_codon:yes gene_type:complete
MSIKTKFLLYFLITIALSFALVIEVILFYNSSSYIDGLISLVILVIFIALYFVIRKDFLLPFNELQKWVRGYKINQNARLEEKQPSSFQPIASAINHLIEENQYLYDDMETILKKQIQRLSKKSASLETLYGISSKLNKMHSTNELFESFLDIYINMTGARSGVARSLNANGELQLAATRGVIDKNGQVSEILVSDCFCGEIALAQDAYVQFSVHTCAKCVGKKSQQQAKVGSIFIPLRYHNKTLGIFNLFFDIEPSLAQDERALLQSISDNISVALDKARLDRETKRMELSQERLLLSQEMHDSLAQTIYSLKLQTTVLGDSIKNSNTSSASKKIANLQDNITQANQELRELMCNFRVPLDAKGIEVSLKNLVNRFKSEEGIATFFQVNGRLKLLPEVEIQILRITQEALANVRKHAKAKNVRILLVSEPTCKLLIEDDGVGFQKDQDEYEIMGNNIGMNIMKERAEIIGAKIDIESDIGEGTRVIVTFKE